MRTRSSVSPRRSPSSRSDPSADPTLFDTERVIVFSTINAANSGGADNTDLWYATRADPALAFSPPQHLADLATDNFEGDPWVSADGCHMLLRGLDEQRLRPLRSRSDLIERIDGLVELARRRIAGHLEHVLDEHGQIIGERRAAQRRARERVRRVRLIEVDGVIEHVEERERTAAEPGEPGRAQHGARERARDRAARHRGVRVLGDALEHGARGQRIRIDEMERLARRAGAARDLPRRIDHVVDRHEVEWRVAAAEQRQAQPRRIRRDQRHQVIGPVELVDHPGLASHRRPSRAGSP